MCSISDKGSNVCTYACSREQDKARRSREEEEGGGTHCSRVKRA